MITSLLVVLSALGVVGCAAGSTPTPASPPPAPPPSAPRLEKLPAHPPPAGHVRPPTDKERQLVRELSRTAARLRGLSFERPVDVEIRDAEAMKQFVHDQLEDEPLDLIRSRYALLGLLDPGLDIWALYLEVMEEQLLGYYDPERGSLAIREDVARRLAGIRSEQDPMDETTLRGILYHELIHALQDQHFDLRRLQSDTLTNDEVMALSALVEGDAMVATFAYYAERTGTPLDALLSVSASAMQQPAAGGAPSKLDAAPPILRETLLFPYREGAHFVRALLQGGGWRKVDAAHRTPPPSTRQVLWPARQLEQVPPSPEIASPAVLRTGEVQVLEEEVLGPYETGLFLQAHGGQPAWAKQWTADRLWQLQLEGAPALAWVLAFSEPTTARRVEAVLAQHPEFHVTRADSRILVLRGVPAALAERLLEGLAA